MSDIITPEFKAHFDEWFEAFRTDPSRDRVEIIREYDELWESYPGRIYLDHEKENELKQAIDKLLGFEVDKDANLIENFDTPIPEPDNFFTLIHSSPGCCWDIKKDVDYLVISRGFFTCKIMTLELEKDFALGFLHRFGEEAMVKKYLDAFEGATPIMRKFLDERVLESYIAKRDKDLPSEWSGAGDDIEAYPRDTSGWSGSFFREVYPGDVGTLQSCKDRAGSFYLIRRAGVFTCSVEFFEDKAVGDVAVEEMIRRKTEYAEAKRLKREELDRWYDARAREEKSACGGAGCASP